MQSMSVVHVPKENEPHLLLLQLPRAYSPRFYKEHCDYQDTGLRKAHPKEVIISYPLLPCILSAYNLDPPRSPEVSLRSSVQLYYAMGSYTSLKEDGK